MTTLKPAVHFIWELLETIWSSLHNTRGFNSVFGLCSDWFSLGFATDPISLLWVVRSYVGIQFENKHLALLIKYLGMQFGGFFFLRLLCCIEIDISLRDTLWPVSFFSSYSGSMYLIPQNTFLQGDANAFFLQVSKSLFKRALKDVVIICVNLLLSNKFFLRNS